jgi:hypothetical protein
MTEKNLDNLMPESNDKPQAIPAWKSRWFKIVATIVALFLIILAITPMIIKTTLSKWLLENGADSVSIENIDFNPFSGTAAVDGLDVQIAEKVVLANTRVYFDISILKLINKGIAVENAILKDLMVDIEQQADGKIRIGSLLIDPAASSEEEKKEKIEKEIAWWLDLGKVTLENCVIRYASPQLSSDLVIDTALLEDLSTLPGEQKASLELAAHFNESSLKASLLLTELTPSLNMSGDVNLEKLSLADFSGYTKDILNRLTSTLDLQGKVNVVLSETKALDAEFDGKLNIAATDVAGKDFNTTAATVNWDGALSYLTNAEQGKQEIKLDGKLGLENYEVKLPAIEAGAANTAWTGKVNYALDRAKTMQDIDITGELNGTQIKLGLLDQNIELNQQEISTTPSVDLKIENKTVQLSGKASLNASGTSVADTAKALTLAAIDSIAIDNATAENLDKIAIRNITVSETKLIQGTDSAQPSITVGETKLANLQYESDKGIAINDISINKLVGTLVREKDGTFDVAMALQGPAPKKTGDGKNETSTAEAGTKDTAERVAGKPGTSKPLGIKISRFAIEQNSTLNFTDNTVAPPYQVAYDISSLELTDIDSNQADKPIPIKLDAKSSKYATMTVDGSIKPFLSQPAIDLTIDIDNVNMVTISPYLIASTGYLVKAGQMRADSKIVIKDNQIDAQNTLFLQKLRLEEVDKEIAKEHAGDIGMPLDKALGLLRDKKDNIKLEVPITGKLDEVEFGMGQIINTALKKATTVGMKTYLLYAFQPYGAMIIAGQSLGKAAGKISLDPVFYEPGKSDLTAKHKDYLAKLGKIMTDRPQIDVQVCGFYTASEVGIQQPAGSNGQGAAGEQLKRGISLGQARENKIKDYLISEHKVDSSRLILCAPELDKDKDAKPRVELVI